MGAEDSDEQRTDSCGLALTIRGIIQCVGFIDRSIPKIVDALQCEYRSDHLENIYMSGIDAGRYAYRFFEFVSTMSRISASQLNCMNRL